MLSKNKNHEDFADVSKKLKYEKFTSQIPAH